MQGAVLGKRDSKVVEHGIEMSVFARCRILVFFPFFWALRLTHKTGYLKENLNPEINYHNILSNLKFQRKLMPGAEGHRNPSPAV